MTERQKKTLAAVLESGICENFYLAGGTAIAVKYSHRHSEDFDFFSERFFSTRTEVLLGKLKDKMQLSVITFGEDTLIFYYEGIKFSFFKYPYRLLRPLEEVSEFPELKIASDEDITAMKAVAIAQRGTKKDFFDLWFLMRRNRWTLKDVSSFCVEKYGTVFPQYHFLKAVTFFEDAEREESFPEVEKVWEEVNNFFVEEVESALGKPAPSARKRRGP